MGRVEYKIEHVHWRDESETRLDELVAHLDEFAKEGWRVVSVDLMAHSSFAVKMLPVLLEREVRLEGEIGERAHELYEQRGRGEGLAAQDWSRAEHEIRKE